MANLRGVLLAGLMMAACATAIGGAAETPASHPETPGLNPAAPDEAVPDVKGRSKWSWSIVAPTDAGPYQPGLLEYNDFQATPEEQTQQKALSRILGARLFASQGDFDQAVEALREAKEAAPGDQEIDLAMAQIQADARKYAEAIETAKSLVERRPDWFDARLTLADAYFEMRNEKQEDDGRASAIEQFEEARKLQPKNLKALQPLGQLYLEELQQDINTPNRVKTAAKIADVYKAMLEASDGRSRIVPLLVLASTYEIMDNLEEAESYFKQAIDLDPSNVHTYQQLGEVYERRGQQDDALAIYRRALVVDPENGRTQARVDELLASAPNVSRKGEKAASAPDPSEAVLAFYQRLAKEYRNNVEIRKLYAIRLVRYDKLDQAVQAYKGIAALDPSDAESRLAIGLLLLQMGSFSEALPALREAETNSGADPIVLSQLADLYERARMPEEAERLYRRAYDEAGPPQKLPRLFQLLQFYEDRQRYEDALAALDRGLKEMGVENTYLLQLERANVLQKLNRPDEAEKAYRDLIAASPNKADAYLSLGMLYDERNNLEQAEALYRKVMEFDPKNSDAYNNLGYMWVSRGMKLADGRQLIEKALELEPGAPHILDSLGWALYQQGDYAGAVEKLEAAVKGMEGKPENAEVFEHLGEAYRKLNRTDDARSAYQKALEADPQRAGLKEKLGVLDEIPASQKAK
ncbi:MAG: tetratricopeptide repeat protein [Candidatus Sumerlaeota bacterium]|nr:tetratricopeptide repeat protein [Candidatus Sumerlaeota bacterium]